MKKKIAIVGCGPRGLSSLESLLNFQAKTKNTINFAVTIFEPASSPGAGQVWNLQQSNSNWMNISDRALQDLNGRPRIDFKYFAIPNFPSYSEWFNSFHVNDTNSIGNIDKFPPRSTMGHYLSERYNSIADVLIKHEVLQVLKARISRVYSKQESLMLIDENGHTHGFDECLLTIGHQPTHASKQILKWKEGSQRFKTNLITEPYNELLYENIGSNEIVAIRGFGLATIDIIRLLTIERGDRFESIGSSLYEFNYIASENSVQQIIPFSLDGLPPMPKPVGKDIDKFFTPDQSQLFRFTSKIRAKLLSKKEAMSPGFLIDSFAEIASEIFLNLGAKRIMFAITRLDLEVLIKRWLENMQTNHDLILDTKLSTEAYMTKTMNMAIGDEPISLDYCIGQIWRHLQPTIYKQLSHSSLSDKVISDIISLDERTKRYSYGPPVESIAQLIALSKAGKLNLNFINDPKIEMDQRGWNLKCDEKNVITNTMVDSVLDAPKLKNINSEIIEYLLKDELLSPVSSNLGVETKADGIVVLAKANEKVNLTMLGRNCKGSVIGVDAILECFGSRIEDWAQGIIDRVNFIHTC